MKDEYELNAASSEAFIFDPHAFILEATWFFPSSNMATEFCGSPRSRWPTSTRAAEADRRHGRHDVRRAGRRTGRESGRRLQAADGDRSLGRQDAGQSCTSSSIRRSSRSEGELTEEEGCLSIPDFVETVTRPERVKLRYLDRNGEQREMWGEGLMARAMCHEIDHLNGTLFVDHLRGFKKDRILKKISKLAKSGMW